MPQPINLSIITFPIIPTPIPGFVTYPFPPYFRLFAAEPNARYHEHQEKKKEKEKEKKKKKNQLERHQSDRPNNAIPEKAGKPHKKKPYVEPN